MLLLTFSAQRGAIPMAGLGGSGWHVSRRKPFAFSSTFPRGCTRLAAFFQNISASFNEVASAHRDHEVSWDAQGMIPGWTPPAKPP